MYVFSGGGYGGSADAMGSPTAARPSASPRRSPPRCSSSTIRSCSSGTRCARARAGPGRQRGGFGVDYKIRMLRGEATASFLMDHGRFGPPGLLRRPRRRAQRGGRDPPGRRLRSPHLSKDEDIRLVAGDAIAVGTPGGGGYGDPWQREPALVARDVRARLLHRRRTPERDYGVVVTAADPPTLDGRATDELRRGGRPKA